MSTRAYGLVALAVVGAGWPRGDARAQTSDRLRKELEGVKVEERLGARVPRDAKFVDDAGADVAMGDYFGRPVLVTLNYSSCPVLCSLQLAGLAKGFKDLRADGVDPGELAIVTISIDPDDTPGRLLGAKQVYVRQTGDYSIAARWHFLSGEAAAIDAVAGAIGFSYVYDAEADEYRHQATLAVLTPDGRVSSYLHGVNYRAADLADAVARARRGDVLGPDAQRELETALLNCFAYDSDSPSPLALRAMRIGGIVTFAGLAVLLLFYLSRERGRRKAQS